MHIKSINCCIWFICYKLHDITLNAYPVDLNTKLTTINYNEGKLNLFRVQVDVTLSLLKDQLDQINHRLNHKDIRRVDNVEYYHPSTDSYGNVWFAKMKLMNDENMRTMISTFGKYSSKEPIKLDASLVGSFKDIRESLIKLIEPKKKS
ncbi:hypothetical protein MTR_1g086160 [Medicago truncatula]|nr:hypothetical protein MTR_1g086160 [Medicago truncatula]